MATQQDKYSQMQSRLLEARQILAQASGDDGYQLGVALLKLHAALEEDLRLEITQKAPSLRMTVEDPQKTSWNELIRYAKQYLRLNEEEARIILEADRQRMGVARGGNYEGSRQELIRYADFVERRCNQRKPAPSEPRYRPVTILREPYERPLLPTSISSEHHPSQGWYRSRLFLLLIFFLMPPLWAALTLSDKEHAGWVRLLSGLMLSLELFVVLVLLNPASTLLTDALPWIAEPTRSPVPVLTATASPEEPVQDNPTPVLSTVTPFSIGGGSCNLAWVEYPSEEIAGMNRSMVWVQVVFFQVRGSGMTARQFYGEVVAHNTQLASDGYEFKRGKTYLLPKCE